MSGNLAGKRALVTAAAQGIGAATARALAEAGAAVVATDLNEAGLGWAAGSAITARRLDVRDPAAIAALAAELGAVDILVNAAGVVHHGTVLDCTEEEWDFAFDLNVKSLYRMIRAFLPAMIAAGGGSIVNIASVVSSVKAAPNRFVYGASKAAVIGLTKAVAADHIRQGIRCNAICPGTIQTPSLDGRIAAFADPVAARKAFIDRQPLGRLGTAEEIAAAALYLAGDGAAFTTGTIMLVDGGFTL
jgi:2-keto-3-deoxy-L-fuconate dehydrogenase